LPRRSAGSRVDSIHSEHIALDDAHRLEVDTSLTSPDSQYPAASHFDSLQRCFRNVLITSLCAPAFALVPMAVAQDTSATQSASAAQQPLLMDAMATELHRALAELGSAAEPVASGKDKVPPQKPYFLSYSVADAESVTITSQYGAIMNSSSSHERTADVQVRLGSPAEDNTHGAHRGSALTTMALPLTDDRAAIERTLWYATNRGYGKALDALEKVKTEQQVRAREEDSSPDFTEERPQVDILAKEPPLAVDRTAWASRLREISGVFRQYPDIFYDTAVLQATHETDYFVSSDGTKVAAPNHVDRGCADACIGRDGHVPRRDVRGRLYWPSGGSGGGIGEDAGDGEGAQRSEDCADHGAV
jgi:hypothetical protein